MSWARRGEGCAHTSAAATRRRKRKGGGMPPLPALRRLKDDVETAGAKSPPPEIRNDDVGGAAAHHDRRAPLHADDRQHVGHDGDLSLIPRESSVAPVVPRPAARVLRPLGEPRRYRQRRARAGRRAGRAYRLLREGDARPGRRAGPGRDSGRRRLAGFRSLAVAAQNQRLRSPLRTRCSTSRAPRQTTASRGSIDTRSVPAGRAGRT